MGHMHGPRHNGASRQELTGTAMVRWRSGIEGGAPGTREAARGYGGASRPAQREGEAMRKAAHDDHSGQRTGERGGDLPAIEVHQGATNM
jgi:hypothetical protein